MEMSKLRKENAYLRKSLDELARQKGEPSDAEKNKLLLERILSLETLRERNAQQLLSRDEEMVSLRSQLRARGGETDAGLTAQLDHAHREAEQRERLLQSLQAETEDVKNKLVAVSAKCQKLESRNVTSSQGCSSEGQGPSGEALRDALEKNQQWLAYDQQREAYVKAVLARVYGLEQQLSQSKRALTEKHNEVHSEERRLVQMQENYDQLVRSAQSELEAQKQEVNAAHKQATELQRRCEEQRAELEDVGRRLRAERLSGQKSAQEERRRSGDREGRLRAEAQETRDRLEDEGRRAAELLLQVRTLQKAQRSQRESQEMISVLEQQIQVSAKDLEDEKKDCQYLQKHLHRVVRELRKAKDYIAQLESEREQWESCSCAPGRPPPSQTLGEGVASPSCPPSLLEESFLECPSCRAQYPTSHYRELLAHLDHCLG